MICMGCDLGAMASKAVVMDGEKLLAAVVVPNQGRMAQAAQQAINQALEAAGETLGGLDAVVGTGWGAKYIPVGCQSRSMLSCLARAGAWLSGEAATIMDIGGLSTTLINVDAAGKVSEYRTNDRCASGTGFFMELAANALELSVDELGPVALQSSAPVFISGQCAVFGESEIVSHINDGAEVPDIARGLANSVAGGVVTMARRLGVEKTMLFSGGLAKNQAITSAVEERLGMKARQIDLDPQILCAVGAALSAAGALQAAEA